MKFIRFFVSLVLTLTIISTGIPFSMIEDASRNGAVGLEDAIILVQDISQPADNTVGFEFDFEKLVSALSVVAGLKNLVNPNKESKSSKHQVQVVFSPDKITNSFSIHLPPQLIYEEVFTDQPVLYESMSLDLSSPPPRII